MVLKLRPSFPTNLYHHHPRLNPNFHVLPAISLSSNLHRQNFPILNHVSTSLASGFRLFCKFNDSDSISHLELGKQYGRQKPEKRVNAVFWIILLNLAIFVADHFFLVRDIKALYLFHNRPAWYQFVTAAFCHANWEASVPRNAVSVGASGAVFGLFAISVLVKMSMDWRKILEVLILGQFVIEKVMEAAQASTGLSNGFIGAYTLQNVNHIAHLSGAMVGVLLVWLVSRVPSDPSEKEGLADKNKR